MASDYKRVPYMPQLFTNLHLFLLAAAPGGGGQAEGEDND